MLTDSHITLFRAPCAAMGVTVVCAWAASLQTAKIRVDEQGSVSVHFVFSVCLVFETGFRCTAQDGLELVILLSLLPKS